jgi:NurA domain
MSLDFQQVRVQVQELGKNAPQTQQERSNKRQQAMGLLKAYAQEAEVLRRKVQAVGDPSLRCALPADINQPEALNAHFSLPGLPSAATLLAADGSQINLDRHAEVEYSLVNVGAIQMRLGDASPPRTYIECQLFYDEQLYNQTEAILALTRDLKERAMLVELAIKAEPPVITFTDGPVELWGAKGVSSEESSSYQKSLAEYLEVLFRLYKLGAITAGYVDKPAANLVVRLLEIANAKPEDLTNIRSYQPLRGVSDRFLFKDILSPGERSAVFELQSQSASNYKDHLALHFFYLSVGRAEHPSLARVEVPAWVAEDSPKLDALHAVLVDQCRIMGARPYPYILHRAHETARVSLEERDQVTNMIAVELRRQGVSVEGTSNKQFAKDQPGRTRR